MLNKVYGRIGQYASELGYTIAVIPCIRQEGRFNIHGRKDYCVPLWRSNPELNSEQPRREQSDIVESDSENYTEGTNDPGPDCTDGESDEEETELKRDEVEMEVESDEGEMDSEIKVGSSTVALHWEMKSCSQQTPQIN